MPPRKHTARTPAPPKNILVAAETPAPAIEVESHEDIKIPQEYTQEIVDFAKDTTEYDRLLQEALDTGNEPSELNNYDPASGLRITEETEFELSSLAGPGAASEGGAAQLGQLHTVEHPETIERDRYGDVLQHDAADFVASSHAADLAAEQRAADDEAQITRGIRDRKHTDRAIMRFGYMTGLAIADNITGGYIPGEKMVRRIARDPEVSKAINDCLDEIAEDLEISKYMNAGMRLGALTVGIMLEIKSAEAANSE